MYYKIHLSAIDAFKKPAQRFLRLWLAKKNPFIDKIINDVAKQSKQKKSLFYNGVDNVKMMKDFGVRCQ